MLKNPGTSFAGNPVNPLLTVFHKVLNKFFTIFPGKEEIIGNTFINLLPIFQNVKPCLTKTLRLAWHATMPDSNSRSI